ITLIEGYHSSLLPSTEICGVSSAERILGGEETELDEFPWMALLQYTKPFVQPICLPWGSQMFEDYLGTSAEVAGWGILNINEQKLSQVLMVVTLPIVDMAKCEKSFKKYTTLSKNQLCVGGNEGKDSCGGDSGGPLMKPSAAHGAPRYYVIGLVSFGSKRCGLFPIPAIYTNTAKYLDWILGHLRP
ncbi:CLIP domain-containing serine protease 2-like, partial [Agrilus planipennis]|uniref:CLIP domain-containing serine protease 2-like n=1 Tax=Agrilus planipennis TaxID=224129 RepID=A0A7F5RIR1_AGRPL